MGYFLLTLPLGWCSTVGVSALLPHQNADCSTKNLTGDSKRPMDEVTPQIFMNAMNMSVVRDMCEDSFSASLYARRTKDTIPILVKAREGEWQSGEGRNHSRRRTRCREYREPLISTGS